MNKMTQQYIICMLWSSNDESTPNGGDPLDTNYTIDDLAPETLQKCIDDCDAFIERAGALVEGLDPTDLGHDFWLTRCGHGAGFWDGDYDDEIGEKLTELSKQFGNLDAYVGDDGKIYLG